ncbi:MAG: AAA family ATPase [Myxococcales bacterium]|nr:MAG: AAA family ATPase [Myxococcales bacterium]
MVSYLTYKVLRRFAESFPFLLDTLAICMDGNRESMTFRCSQTKALYRGIFLAHAFAFVCVFCSPAVAQVPAANEAKAQAKQGDEKGPRIAELQQLADHLESLLAGKLAADVDPRALLALEPDPELQEPAAVFAYVTGARKELPEELRDPNNPLLAAKARVWTLKRRFVQLAKHRQAKLISDHARRRELAAEQASKQAVDQKKLLSLKKRIKSIREFMAAQMDPSLEPMDVLRVDLSDLRKLEGVSSKTKRPLPPLSDQTPKTASDTALPQGAALPSSLAAAEQQLDQLLFTFFQLPAEEQRRLFELHKQQQLARQNELASHKQLDKAKQEAERAAQERHKILQALKHARSEQARRAAELEASLLHIKEQQALFRSGLLRKQQELDKTKELALGWERQVKELMQGALWQRSHQEKADVLYDELVSQLETIRKEFAVQLRALSRSDVTVPVPKPLEESELLQETAKSVRKTHKALMVQAAKLQDYYDKTLWKTATTQRDALVSMNQARLDLLQLLTPNRRHRLQSFGPEGLAQAQRELFQMSLELRYHVLAAPILIKKIMLSLRNNALSFSFSVAKLLLLILAFRWWRRHGGRYLVKLRDHWTSVRPVTSVSQVGAIVVWYIEHVRRPLEWLLLFGLIFNWSGVFSGVPEFYYLWLVAKWGLIGALTIRLLDALVVRQGDGRSKKDTSGLRIRSLRLIGAVVVLIGLILSFTAQSVGKGAIYHWVLWSCWFSIVPFGVLLVRWWRSIIVTRLEALGPSHRLADWAMQHHNSVVGFVVVTIGGFYLLVHGIYRFVLSHLSQLEVIQRALAYLFRRQVAKRNQSIAAPSYKAPLPEELYAALDPLAPAKHFCSGVMEDRLGVVRKLARDKNNTIAAVIGERGLGKSTFLRQVVEGLPASELCFVRCTPGGFDVFCEQVAKELGFSKHPNEDELVLAMREKGPRLVCIDDAHRLVRPVIGGLADLDRLNEFARKVGSSTSWIIALSSPAWQYVERARSDRALFDEVVYLRPWSESQIAELIATRSDGVIPELDFRDLVVPRHFDPASYQSESERTKTDYIRMLWDYADGNPAVALYYWRESLHLSSAGKTRVNLFDPPEVRGATTLPMSLYFVLRAIVQLELALESDIVECTALRPADVADALRFARTRSYIETVGQRIQIALPWYRAITVLLQRQHLLVTQ